MREKEIVASRKDRVKADIFVAGLPPSTDKLAIKGYFEQFGAVLKVVQHGSIESKYVNNPIQPHATAKNKIFFKVSLDSRETLQKILEIEAHVFMGRNLFCQEFLTGEQRVRHTSEICSRRVIIKRIPYCFPESELIEILQRIAGPIESFYEFKSDRSLLIPEKRKFKSCSVTFKNQESAITVTGLNPFPLTARISILIEKFDTQMSKLQVSSAASTKGIRSNQHFINEKVSNKTPSLKFISGKIAYYPYPIYQIKHKAINTLSTSLGTPGPSSKEEILGEKNGLSSMFNVSQNHAVKPTRTLYFEFSSNLNDIHSNDKLQSSSSSLEKDNNSPNYRFNMVKRSLF